MVIVDNYFNLYSWGNNSNGELGIGDYDLRVTPTLVSFLQGKRISKIACGSNFAIALGENVHYNSKLKPSNPLRQPTDNKGYKSAKYESPKTVETTENIEKIFLKRNILDRGSIDKHIIDKKSFDDDNDLRILRSSNDLLQNEISYKNEEIRKLSEALSTEQARNKGCFIEIEELRNQNLMNLGNIKEDELLTQSQSVEIHRLKMILEETKHQNFAIEIECKSYKEEVQRLQDFISKREHEFADELDNKLNSQALKLSTAHGQQIDSLQDELELAKIQAKQIESNLNITNSHKNRLEEALSSSNNNIKELKKQLDQTLHQVSLLESQTRSLEAEKKASENSYHNL